MGRGAGPAYSNANCRPCGSRKIGAEDGSGKGEFAPALRPGSFAAPAGLPLLLVLDVLDDLGHVVLVLAELGGVLDELLLFLLGLAFDGCFLALGGFGLLGLGLGLDFGLFGAATATSFSGTAATRARRVLRKASGSNCVLHFGQTISPSGFIKS